jgi:hypothetical protein
MPKGPRGEKRPGDVIGAAIMVAKIATGEIEESPEDVSAKRSDAGKRGGHARARALTAEQRSTVAKAGAKARWRKAAPGRETAK